ncbi:MAG: OB-fold nucleic acid binding domain-containing protein, partial [Hyphomicrobiales bacterium]
MKRTLIKNVLNSPTAVDRLQVSGWVRTRRDSKGFSFLEVNDGSCLKNLQVIVDEAVPAFSQLKDVATGAAVEIEGALVESPGAGQ